MDKKHKQFQKNNTLLQRVSGKKERKNKWKTKNYTHFHLSPQWLAAYVYLVKLISSSYRFKVMKYWFAGLVMNYICMYSMMASQFNCDLWGMNSKAAWMLSDKIQRLTESVDIAGRTKTYSTTTLEIRAYCIADQSYVLNGVIHPAIGVICQIDCFLER